jgi:hypothetical protein
MGVSADDSLAKKLNIPKNTMMRRSSSAPLPPIVGDKYKFTNQLTRSRNDIRLMIDLNKQLISIKGEVKKIVDSRHIFAEKKDRIVKVHDRAEVLFPSTETKLPKIESTISEPFGLQGFMEELASFQEH